jgi:hypothetical protein
MKKRIIISFCIIMILSFAAAQENLTKPKRTFTGSGSINLGKYEDFYLRVVPQEKIISGMPGDTIHFKLFVRRGDDPAVAHDVRIIGDDPDLPLSVLPAVIARVRNTDMVPVKASISIPSDTEPGRYPVRIKIAGKEFVEESYPLDLTLVVGENKDIWRYAAWAVSLAICSFVYIRTRALRRKR